VFVRVAVVVNVELGTLNVELVVAVAVREYVGVCVLVPVNVLVGCTVFVRVNVHVPVAVIVPVLVIVGVIVLVHVGVPVLVPVNVPVGCTVFVRVAVPVAVRVIVGVIVLVPVAVIVLVLVAVGVAGCGIICIPFIFAFSTLDINSIVICPPVACILLNTLSSALYAPTSPYMSKLLNTSTPFILTLNTLCPAPVIPEYISANFNVT